MSTENLHNQEAIDKLKELVNSIDVGMVASFENGNDYPYIVPMSRQEVDDQGNIWYLFSSESQSFKNFQSNNKVALAFAHVGDNRYLSVNGTVAISTDQARIDKYWNKFTEAYFEKGREDPTIRVLKVTPVDAHYWDTKHNKLVTFLKVATSIVTGQNMDLGKEGDINL